MTSNTAHDTIKSFIEDSNNAYAIYHQTGNMNSDFAEFAALAYQDFQTVLKRPDLTQRQVRRMVRRASNSHRTIAPNSCWSTFLASYLKNPANTRDII